MREITKKELFSWRLPSTANAEAAKQIFKILRVEICIFQCFNLFNNACGLIFNLLESCNWTL